MSVYRVETDALRNIILATDCDKLRKKYREKGDNVEVIFSSPYINVLEKYRYFLLRNCQKKVLETKYYYRPDYLSFDEYGTETLWYLLLFVNDIPCIEEFNKHEVIIPSYLSVLEITKENLSSDITDINVKDKVSKNILNLYLSRIKPNLETEDSENEVVVNPKALYWIRQKFEVTPGIEENGFIDLAYEAIPETISFKVEHGGNFIYNVDYCLVKSFDQLLRRISWRPEDCAEGAGLLGSIKQNMMLEVVYAKKTDE